MNSNSIESLAEIDVKDWGLVGDGVADDSAAVRRAIDHLAARGGGTVRFGGGVYRLGVPLPNSVRLIGG